MENAAPNAALVRSPYAVAGHEVFAVTLPALAPGAKFPVLLDGLVHTVEMPRGALPGHTVYVTKKPPVLASIVARPAMPATTRPTFGSPSAATLQVPSAFACEPITEPMRGPAAVPASYSAPDSPSHGKARRGSRGSGRTKSLARERERWCDGPEGEDWSEA